MHRPECTVCGSTNVQKSSPSDDEHVCQNCGHAFEYESEATRLARARGKKERAA